MVEFFVLALTVGARRAKGRFWGLLVAKLRDG
jgi:hypothetical protein